MRARVGLEDEAPVLLKMDIERSEYELLHSMLMSGPRHLLPVQIIMEIHIVNRYTRNFQPREQADEVTRSVRRDGEAIFSNVMPWYSRVETLSAVATLMELLWQVGGYTIVDVGRFATHGCFEVLLARVP